jgi:hypothetical protein
MSAAMEGAPTGSWPLLNELAGDVRALHPRSQDRAWKNYCPQNMNCTPRGRVELKLKEISTSPMLANLLGKGSESHKSGGGNSPRLAQAAFLEVSTHCCETHTAKIILHPASFRQTAVLKATVGEPSLLNFLSTFFSNFSQEPNFQTWRVWAQKTCR